MMITCSSEDCNGLPVFRLTWPGNNEQLACIDCATKLKNTAKALDFHLQLIHIKGEEYTK